VIISDDRLAQAMKYLAETDGICAELKVQVARKEYIAKKVRARLFLEADGNNEERKNRAEVSADTYAAELEKYAAMAEFEKVRAKRDTEAMVVDVWRSMNANRRQGGFQ
jgi:hypothetical protein